MRDPALLHLDVGAEGVRPRMGLEYAFGRKEQARGRLAETAFLEHPGLSACAPARKPPPSPPSRGAPPSSSPTSCGAAWSCGASTTSSSSSTTPAPRRQRDTWSSTTASGSTPSSPPAPSPPPADRAPALAGRAEAPSPPPPPARRLSQTLAGQPLGKTTQRARRLPLGRPTRSSVPTPPRAGALHVPDPQEADRHGRAPCRQRPRLPPAGACRPGRRHQVRVRRHPPRRVPHRVRRKARRPGRPAVLPDLRADEELSDDDLEQVAGGTDGFWDDSPPPPPPPSQVP